MTLPELSKIDNAHSVEDDSTIVKAAIKFSSGTMLSRITGLLRDMSMAFCFGTDASIAAFLVAFRFANLLRRIFGEGALLNSFIPHYESYRKIDSKKGAEFFRDVFYSLTFVLISTVIIIEIFLFSYAKWISASEDTKQIIHLTMLMFPGLIFICLYSICAAFLQCQKKFFIAGVAPVAFNIVWIIAIWIGKQYTNQIAVLLLSLSIVVAYVFQWLATMPLSLKYLNQNLMWKDYLDPKIFSPEIKTMLSSLSLGVIGVSATQINSAIDTVFARYASLEGPAYLNYAIHLVLLPLSLIGVGMSTALLPSLSRNLDSYENFKNMIHKSINKALFLLIPCTLAILCLGQTGINLLFGRGDFDFKSTYQTILCLWGYGIGLIPMSLILLITPVFYAQKNFKTPMFASLSSIALNMLLNYVFVFYLKLGPASLALATSITALVNLIILSNQIKKISWNQFLIPSLKLLLASIVAAYITIYVGSYYFNDSTLQILKGETEIQFNRVFKDQVVQFANLSIIFFGFLFIFSYMLKLRKFIKS